MTQSMVAPTLHWPLQAHTLVAGVTTRDGVRSWWNGQRPTIDAFLKLNPVRRW